MSLKTSSFAQQSRSGVSQMSYCPDPEILQKSALLRVFSEQTQCQLFQKAASVYWSYKVRGSTGAMAQGRPGRSGIFLGNEIQTHTHRCPTDPERLSDSLLNNSEVICGQEVEAKAELQTAPQHRVENAQPQIFHH